MRPQKVDNEQVMTGLMSVLRARGYDGASMNDLASATGLKKASLYHRFPGGKKEIVDAVLSYTSQWSQTHVYAVLTNQSKAPELRLKKALNNINTLYNGGEAICMLRALSMDSSMPLFGDQIASHIQLWIEAFTKLGLDFGYKEQKAKKLAMETLVRIQGSLVLSKALNTTEPFRQSLLEVERIFTQ
jgi:AcrR family transcriptional regulator